MHDVVEQHRHCEEHVERKHDHRHAADDVNKNRSDDVAGSVFDDTHQADDQADDAGKEQPAQGQQQRLAVARALVNNPRVILADEPTGNLDPWAAEDIMEVFRRIVAGGCSIVMSTHNIANIEQFPARTIRFNKGKVEEIDISSVLGA